MATIGLSLVGCGIIPKRVEYLQDKVHEMPAASPKHEEVRKEAAAYTAAKTLKALEASIAENASTNVTRPITEAHIVATSLSGSLGKPYSPFVGPATTIAKRLDHEDAKLSKDLEDFRDKNDENKGKKIEGSGVFQIGYFANLLMLVIVGFLIWIAIKIVGLFYPVVSVGTRVIEGSAAATSKLVGKGFGEMVEGGELFKKWISEEIQDPATQAKVKELFASAHKEKQSRDVQDVIEKLTKKD